MAIDIDFSKGTHTRTRYDASSSKVELAPLLKFKTYPGDWWISDGTNYKLEGDEIILYHDGTSTLSNEFGESIRFAHTTIRPVTVRFKARGVNLVPASYYGDLGFRIDHYNSSGSRVTADSVRQPFPSGTWGPTQFSFTITPTTPIYDIYVNFYAKRASEIHIWDIEVFADGEPTNNKYGIWKSEPVDLYAVKNMPVTSKNTTELKNVGFFYTRLDDINGLNSISHSVEELTKYDIIVVDPPSSISVREKDVLRRVINRGTTVFGYIAIGREDDHWHEPEEMYALIEEMKDFRYFGVFLDIAGYDYECPRERFNDIVMYARQRGMPSFVNAWNLEDVLDNNIDPLWNPDGKASALNKSDYILFESFYSRSDDEGSQMQELSAYNISQWSIVSIQQYKTTTVSGAVSFTGDIAIPDLKDAEVNCSFEFKDASGTVIATGTKKYTAPTSMTYFSVSTTLPAGAANVLCYVYIQATLPGGGGTILLDNVSLRVAGTELLTNVGFDAYSGNNGVADGWTVPPRDAAFVIKTQVLGRYVGMKTSSSDNIDTFFSRYSTAMSLATARDIKGVTLAYKQYDPDAYERDKNIAYILSHAFGMYGYSYGNTKGGDVELPAISVGGGDSRRRMTRVSDTRWEFTNTESTIWFEAKSNPFSRSAGVFSTNITTASDDLPTTGHEAHFDADRVSVRWEHSDDREVWSEFVAGTKPKRFVRMSALLQSGR